MAGTGLPIPKDGVLAQGPGVIDQDQFSAAGAFRELARVGQTLAAAGADALQRDATLARMGYLADRDTADNQKSVELENQFRDDPEGFRRAWKGYSDGAMGGVEPSLVPVIRKSLGNLGDTAYRRIAERRYTQDRAANIERIGVAVENASTTMGAMAQRGEFGTPGYVAQTEKLRAQLDGLVATGAWTTEKADQLFASSVGTAQAEGVLFEAQKVYAAERAKGGDALAAAQKVVDERIINAPDLPFTPDQRRAYASKIKADLGAEEAQRRQDVAVARSAANDAMNAMRGGVRVAPETIDNLSDQLKAAGDQAGAARLNAAAVRAEQLRDQARMPLAAQIAEVRRLNIGVVQPTEADATEARGFLRTRLSSGQTNEAIDGMSGEMATRLSALIQSAPPEIQQKLGVMSGYRTTERQASLYADAVRKYGSEEAARKWVAPPGRSNHNHGDAADLSFDGQSLSKAPKEVVDWLHQNAAAYGLKFPLANENWHIEVAETRGGGGGSFVDKVIGAESSGNATATNPRSSATGAGQFIDSTWMTMAGTYRPDLMQGRTPEQVLALRNDPQLAREMTSAYAKENADFLTNQGVPVRDGTLHLAHFAGPRGAAQLFKADPNTPVEQVLGEQAVAANPHLKGMTAGQVVAWADNKMGGGGASGAPVTSDLRQVRDAQDVLGREVDRQWQKVRADLDAGVRPEPAALSDLIAGARLAGDNNLLEDLADRLGRYDLTKEMGQASLGAQQAGASSFEQAGAMGLLEPGKGAWIKDAQAVVADTRSGLENDPVGLVAKRFPERFAAPAPLDMGNRDKFLAGLQQRAAMAQFGSQVFGVGPLPALGPGDLAQVQAVFDGPDLNAKVRLATDLTAALPEGVRIATWAKLGAKGPAAALNSFAGGLMPADPEVATSIFRGQQALAADPRYAPKEGTEGEAFRERLDKSLPATAFDGAGRTGATGPYNILRDAIRSRYADLSATAGDTSGKLDQHRLDRAVEDITGGVLTHNGGAVIAPQRGMTQAQFDGVLAGITDADLAGVTTLSGTPVAAEYLRSSASLEANTQGRYLVRLNQDPTRPAYASRNGQPFVLDLNGRQPAQPRSTLPAPGGVGGQDFWMGGLQ